MQDTHLTVAAVVERQGRYLFVEERIDGREVINQPAGHVEPGETLRAAVSREMREETAYGFEPEAIVGAYLWTHPESGERFLRVVFTGMASDHDESQELDDGILRALWLTREELLERAADHRSPMVLRAVDDYEAGERFPANMFQFVPMQELAEHATELNAPGSATLQ